MRAVGGSRGGAERLERVDVGVAEARLKLFVAVVVGGGVAVVVAVVAAFVAVSFLRTLLWTLLLTLLLSLLWTLLLLLSLTLLLSFQPLGCVRLSCLVLFFVGMVG